MRENKTIEVGYESVIIDKIFGPMVFAALRITPIAEKNTWLIERQMISNGNWIPWCEIPGQFDFEFEDENE